MRILSQDGKVSFPENLVFAVTNAAEIVAYTEGGLMIVAKYSGQEKAKYMFDRLNKELSLYGVCSYQLPNDDEVTI